MLFLEHQCSNSMAFVPWSTYSCSGDPSCGDRHWTPLSCLVLPLHHWLEAKCFQDSVLNHPHQEGFERGSVELLSWKPLTRGLMGVSSIGQCWLDQSFPGKVRSRRRFNLFLSLAKANASQILIKCMSLSQGYCWGYFSCSSDKYGQLNQQYLFPCIHFLSPSHA